MYRVAFIGLLASIVFGLLFFLPVVGPIFLTLAIASISIAAVSFVVAVIKTLFFDLWC